MSLVSIAFSLALLAAPSAKDGIATDVAALQSVRDSTGVRFSVFESRFRRSIVSSKDPHGYLVRFVDPHSPAADAGLQKGDVVMNWDGKPIRSLAELRDWIAAAKPDEPIAIQVSRKKPNPPWWSRHPWKDLELRIVPRRR